MFQVSHGVSLLQKEETCEQHEQHKDVQQSAQNSVKGVKRGGHTRESAVVSKGQLRGHSPRILFAV
jgi:hypothetical protein